MQLVNFPCVHLVAGGWYLDYSRGLVPDVENPLYINLICVAHEVNKLEGVPEEDKNPTPHIIQKEVASVKGNMSPNWMLIFSFMLKIIKI